MVKKIVLLILCLIISRILIHSQSLDSFMVKPYLQYATQDGIFVMWETPAISKGFVEYTKAKMDVDSIIFDQRLDSDKLGTMHEVGLDNLEVNAKYIYRVTAYDDKGKPLVGDISTFKTAVNQNDPFKFVLIGDTQRNGRTPWAWGKIAKLAWESRPDFLVLAGDLVDQGNRKEDWTEHFFPNGNVVMKRYPIYSVLGNHEQDSPNYYAYMHNPEPEYYYSFNYGNAEFFMIDTNRDVFEGSEQYNWLEWALAKSDAKWKFVVHHHPPYSSDSDDHGNTMIGMSKNGTKARDLVPLLEQYGVDFCLFGHTHLYERTFPILEDKINLINGVVYINSGGAGGGLEDFDPVRNWFTSELRSVHHFCTFTVFEDQIEFKAIDHEGRVFDQYAFKKNSDGVKFTSIPAPRIKTRQSVFQNEAEVRIEAMDENLQIRYTLDGKEPSLADPLYTQAIKIAATTNVKAKAFDKEGHMSRTVGIVMTKMKPLPSLKIEAKQKGVSYKYYEGRWKELPDFSKQNKLAEGTTSMVQLKDIPHRADHFGVVFEAYLSINQTDTYSFYTYSDDGSRLYIDDRLVVDADGNHSMSYYEGTTILEKGFHKIKVEYFESLGSEGITVGMSKGETRTPLSPFDLFIK